MERAQECIGLIIGNIMVDAHMCLNNQWFKSPLKIHLDIMHVRLSGWRCYVHMNMNTLRHSHVHVRLAGSGLHIPLDIQVAVILVDGTNIGLHMKNISAPSVVFWYGSIEPSAGGVGSLQLTGGRKKVLLQTTGYVGTNMFCFCAREKPVCMNVYGWSTNFEGVSCMTSNSLMVEASISANYSISW